MWLACVSILLVASIGKTQTTRSTPAVGDNLLLADGSFELGDPDWCMTTVTADDLAAALDRDQSYPARGHYSARWLIEPEHDSPTTCIPLPLVDGVTDRTCCLSISLRASSSQTLTASISPSTGGKTRVAQWHVGTKWRRYELSFSRDLGGKSPATLTISARRPRHPWVLWIDAVKVESGRTATDYRAADVALIGTPLGLRSGLYFQGQPMRIVAGVQCPARHSADAKLRWRLIGAGETIRSVGLALDAPIVRGLPVYDASLPRGRYHVELELHGRDNEVLARRTAHFGVARRLTGLSDPRFKLTAPFRGPRSDAMAEQIGLTITEPAPASSPTTTAVSSLPATATVSPLPATTIPSESTVGGRIADLTRARMSGATTVHWPTAWRELLDAHRRWRSPAVAVNVWLDLLAGTVPLRCIRLDDGRVAINVLGGQSRTVAIVTGSRRPLTRSGLMVPLVPSRLTVRDMYGARITTQERDGHTFIDLGTGPVYLVAGPDLARGRFVLQLRESRVVGDR